MLKRFKTPLLLVTVFSVGYFLTGCEEEAADCAVGEWAPSAAADTCVDNTLVTITSNSLTFQYDNCGDCPDGAAWYFTQEGTYTINGDSITMDPTRWKTCDEDWTDLSNEESETSSFACDGNTLTVDGEAWTRQ